jgi:Flp pilus assembly secretin CpaC
MTASCDRGWRRQLHLHASALVAILMLAAPVRADETITVLLDQAKVAKLPDRVATVIVGNPLIADVTVQAGGLIVITGKGYGVTNLIALDRSGAVLREQSIEVQGPLDDVVVVYRGVSRESYSCTPMCERRITLGDTPEFFDATLGETGARNSGALGSAVTSGQGQGQAR